MSEQTTSSGDVSGTRLSLPVAIVIGSLVIAGAIFATKGVSGASNTASAAALRSPSTEDHIVGSPKAPVVIVEFADFECPYCSVIYPTLKKIVDGSNGKVAWVYRNLPLTSIHPQAEPAAEAAECIAGELGNDAFWKFADKVFGDQQDLSPSFYTKEAAALGADPKAFAACIASKQYDSRIQQDEAEAVTNGGQGTPFSIVIGRDGTRVPFSGALPYDQVNAIVQSVLSKNQ